MKRLYSLTLTCLLAAAAVAQSYTNGLFVVCDNTTPYKNGQLNYYNFTTKTWKNKAIELGWQPYTAFNDADDSFVVLGNSDNAVQRYNSATLTSDLKVAAINDYNAVPKAGYADERTLWLSTALGSTGMGLRTYDVETKKETVIGSAEAVCKAIVKAGDHIYVETGDKSLKIYDAKTKTEVKEIKNASNPFELDKQVWYFDLQQKALCKITSSTLAQEVVKPIDGKLLPTTDHIGEWAGSPVRVNKALTAIYWLLSTDASSEKHHVVKYDMAKAETKIIFTITDKYKTKYTKISRAAFAVRPTDGHLFLMAGNAADQMLVELDGNGGFVNETPMTDGYDPVALIFTADVQQAKPTGIRHTQFAPTAQQRIDLSGRRIETARKGQIVIENGVKRVAQ